MNEGDTDQTARLVADRDRLRGEVEHGVRSLAAGVPVETLAPVIRERETAIARLGGGTPEASTGGSGLRPAASRARPTSG